MKINFLGNGSGFTDNHTNGYFITDTNDLVLIDLSMNNYSKLLNFPLKDFNNIYVLITHMHDDHISGIGMLVQYCYYVLKKKLVILAETVLLDKMVDNLDLRGIYDDIYNMETLCHETFDWFLGTIVTKHDPYLDGECFGYRLRVNGTVCVYSGDTNILEPYLEYLVPGVEFYVDISYFYGGVHLKFDDVKEKLFELSAQGIDIFLMHLDDINSIRRVIDGSKLSVAELGNLNAFSLEEIKAIKDEVCFNNNDILNKLHHLINDTSLDSYELNELFNKIEKGELTFPAISPRFDKKQVHGYFIDTSECEVVESYGEDWYFDVADENVYVSAFSWGGDI